MPSKIYAVLHRAPNIFVYSTLCTYDLHSEFKFNILLVDSSGLTCYCIIQIVNNAEYIIIIFFLCGENTETLVRYPP